MTSKAAEASGSRIAIKGRPGFHRCDVGFRHITIVGHHHRVGDGGARSQAAAVLIEDSGDSWSDGLCDAAPA